MTNQKSNKLLDIIPLDRYGVEGKLKTNGMGNRINKEKALREFSENAQVNFKIECNICGEKTESDADDMALDAAESLDNFKRQLWKYGWRFSVSKTYGHVGIHCPECHRDRNK